MRNRGLRALSYAASSLMQGWEASAANPSSLARALPCVAASSATSTQALRMAVPPMARMMAWASGPGDPVSFLDKLQSFEHLGAFSGPQGSYLPPPTGIPRVPVPSPPAQ